MRWAFHETGLHKYFDWSSGFHHGLRDGGRGRGEGGKEGPASMGEGKGRWGGGGRVESDSDRGALFLKNS